MAEVRVDTLALWLDRASVQVSTARVQSGPKSGGTSILRKSPAKATEAANCLGKGSGSGLCPVEDNFGTLNKNSFGRADWDVIANHEIMLIWLTCPCPNLQ